MILKILFILVAIFALGVITVLQAKSDLIADIEKNIGLAETKPITNEQKMSLVVDTVYNAVIPFAAMYFTRTRIENIAQSVYDRMKYFYKARTAKNTQGDETVK